MTHGVLRARAVAGGQQHRNAGEALADLAREVEPVHAARHQDVGEHQVDIAVEPQRRDRRLRAGDAAHVVAELAQIIGADFGHVGIVLDQQHRAGKFDRRLRRRSRHDRRGRLMTARQKDRDGGAAPLPARDRHRAAGLLGEAIDLAQAQTGALADVLGGEERLEHPRQNVGRNAVAGIRHADGDEFAAQALFGRLAFERHRLGADRQRAAVWHGVLGVDRKIEDGELELARIDPDRHKDRQARRP